MANGHAVIKLFYSESTVHIRHPNKNICLLIEYYILKTGNAYDPVGQSAKVVNFGRTLKKETGRHEENKR